jgi:hypothetical protein
VGIYLYREYVFERRNIGWDRRRVSKRVGVVCVMGLSSRIGGLMMKGVIRGAERGV